VYVVCNKTKLVGILLEKEPKVPMYISWEFVIFYPAKDGNTERGHIGKNLGLLNCGCVNMSCDVAPSLYSINQPTFAF